MFLIRAILLFLLISIVLRIIGRILFSVRGDRQNDRRSSYFEKRKKEEGRVTVMKNPDQKEKKKMVRKNEGEYIRFEEIHK